MSEQNNNVPQTQNKSLSKADSNENLFLVARSTSLIRDISDKDIRLMLLYVMKMVGINEMPTQMEEVVLLDYTKSSLAKYTIDEIKLAFTLYCNGKLDTDRESFGKLSSLYLGRVMESYSRWCYKYKNKPTEEVAEPKPLSDEELINGAISKFNAYKKTKILNDHGNVAYKFLKRLKIIDLSEEEKEEIRLRAIPILKSRESERGRTIQDINAVIKNFNPELEKTKAKIDNICCELALEKYFLELIENGIPIEKIFDKES